MVFDLGCLRRALTAAPSCKHNEISVDDLIPIVVFVIIKSNLTHWIPTLQFLNQFIFTEMSDGFDKGANCFLVTTLEAAIHYISSLDTTISMINPKCLIESNSENGNSTNQKRRHFSSKEDFVNYLFDKIKAEDEIEIIKLLKTDRDIEIKADNENDELEEIDGSDSGNGSMENRECVGASCNSLCTLSACRLNIQNRHGIGAVHITAMYGLAKMLNVLLALEADPQITDENNYTALHYAAARGHQNALLLLLHAGANINALTNDKYTPLHFCCLNGHENCVKALLYYSDHMRIRVHKNAQSRMGDTALHLAAKWGFAEIVETLLEYGVKTDLSNRLGHTPHDYAHNSHIASLLQNVFVVIEHPDNDESWNANRISPAASPPSSASQEIFRGCILPDTSNTDGNSITCKTNNDKIVAAIRNNDTKLAAYFLGIEIFDDIEPTNCHPLCTCEKCVHINRMQAIQNRQNEQNMQTQRYTGDINEASSIDGQTPLHAATQANNIELIEHCFKLGARVNPQTITIQQTALHYAILSKCQEITELILNHVNYETDDINLQDANGNTALHLAVQVGRKQLVECLLTHEPRLNLLNGEGQTALDIAKASLKLNIVQLFENVNGDV